MLDIDARGGAPDAPPEAWINQFVPVERARLTPGIHRFRLTRHARHCRPESLLELTGHAVAGQRAFDPGVGGAAEARRSELRASGTVSSCVVVMHAPMGTSVTRVTRHS